MVKNILSIQESKRIEAKALLKAKRPIAKISKDVGVSEKTVKRLRRRGPKRKKGSGKRQILDRSDKLSIRNLIKANPFLTPPDIVNRLDLECHPETVRRYLISAGYRYKKIQNKEPLTNEQKILRLQWCAEWGNFDGFDEVIFTDETGYWLNDTKGKGWVPKGTVVAPTEIRSREKVNIYGAISMAGKVTIHVYRENLNSTKYEEILKNELIPAAQELYPEGCFLQQDNHPSHNADNIWDYLNSPKCDVIKDVITWPACSSDFNPMENLWAVLKGNIRKRQPQTIEDLEDIIIEEWEDLSDDYIQNLCSSINDRIEMCIENEGGRINY